MQLHHFDRANWPVGVTLLKSLTSRLERTVDLPLGCAKSS